MSSVVTTTRLPGVGPCVWFPWQRLEWSVVVSSRVLVLLLTWEVSSWLPNFNCFVCLCVYVCVYVCVYRYLSVCVFVLLEIVSLTE